MSWPTASEDRAAVAIAQSPQNLTSAFAFASDGVENGCGNVADSRCGCAFDERGHRRAPSARHAIRQSLQQARVRLGIAVSQSLSDSRISSASASVSASGQIAHQRARCLRMLRAGDRPHCRSACACRAKTSATSTRPCSRGWRSRHPDRPRRRSVPVWRPNRRTRSHRWLCADLRNCRHRSGGLIERILL